MNKAGRIAASINSQSNHFQLRAFLFHSTPVSERKRGTHWDSASFAKVDPKTFNWRQRRLRKKSLLRNVDEFTENIFQSWKPNREKKPEPPPRRRKSWFQPNVEDYGPSRARSRNRTSRFRTRFEFCDVDDGDGDFDNVFRSMFGGNRSFYWSFTKDDEPRYWSSSTYSSNFRTSSGWTYHFDEEYEQEFNTSKEYERPVEEGSRTDRLALGLSSSGPLKMDDVKTAYRACALKWHPDRHQGSSKVVAEEKFKVCSAADSTVPTIKVYSRRGRKSASRAA